MGLCPLCNGFETKSFQCPNCQSLMEDQGKVIDYFDDYSAYMDIDVMKLFDGYEKSLENHECIHYFYCLGCQHQETKSIGE
ncbi:hypothetical protein FS935_15380 [Metabacillus litoralis]|uniref:Uncharacterized protein n=1 Tax=Metabacillus litoralis TaxID=152268 RepID=A0A5C6VW34_9BACI|nr:hypothetical protein [Metabacillus litoralis]TXC89746.1 hypothetical protein FS935_15380 [Metabacillus litoralis]